MLSQSFSPNIVQGRDINWITSFFMAAFHVGAVVALFFFSWKALIIAMVLWWVSGSFGIGMGYHRLLTHRGYTTPKWMEYVLTVCATLTLEGGTDFLGRDASHPSSIHGPGRGSPLSARREMVVAYGLDSNGEIYASRHDHASPLCS